MLPNIIQMDWKMYENMSTDVSYSLYNCDIE